MARGGSLSLNAEVCWQAVCRSQAVVELAPDGTITWANDVFCDLLRYRGAALVGLHHRTLCTPAYAASPDYAQFWARLRAGNFEQGRYARVASTGEVVWLRATYNPVIAADGSLERIVKVAIDVTAAAREHAAARAKIAAVDRAQGVAEFALDGTILNANPKFLAMTGYRLEELVGLHHSTLCMPGDTERVDYASFWAALANNSLQEGMFRRVTRTGQVLWLQATYNPVLDANGRPISVVKFATDITRQVLLEQQMEERLEESQRYRAALTERGEQLERMAQQVDTIVRSVGGIANQTKMVGFNASIEALRAGDAGAGMAAIASEVGELAASARVLTRLAEDVLQTAMRGAE